jgi:hypothetical protein
MLAESQVESEEQPPVGRNGSAVNCTEVVTDKVLASRNKPAGVHAEVRTRVDEELLFSNPVRDEEAACGCSADMRRR